MSESSNALLSPLARRAKRWRLLKAAGPEGARWALALAAFCALSAGLGCLKDSGWGERWGWLCHLTYGAGFAVETLLALVLTALLAIGTVDDPDVHGCRFHHGMGPYASNEKRPTLGALLLGGAAVVALLMIAFGRFALGDPGPSPALLIVAAEALCVAMDCLCALCAAGCFIAVLWTLWTEADERSKTADTQELCSLEAQVIGQACAPAKASSSRRL